MLVSEAFEQLVAQGTFAAAQLPDDIVERPREKSHGDWACTLALKLAKQLSKNPREIAEQLSAALASDERIAAVEVAGPGFINLTLSATALQDEIRNAHEQGADYAKCDIGGGMSVNVEFISANPTGPMHVGHGRWAALGNALCRVLEHAGWQVTREFYINDAGHQMDVFGNSVYLRYLELQGQEIEIPEEFYGGSYVTDIASAILHEIGDMWINPSSANPSVPVLATEIPAASVPDASGEPEYLAFFRETAYRMMLADIQNLCERVGVQFDVWFSERTLYVSEGEDAATPIERGLIRLKERGFLFEQDGATWFRTTDFGDDKDRVLVKSNGEYTYFCPDIAYHLDKLERETLGSEFLINIWGADHHGYIPRMQSAMSALGHEGHLRVLLGQMVNLYRDGEAVRMSKRTGEMVTFEELIDEVGADATKYLMLSRSSDQPIDFDIEVAKRADASNPVYYVQYAHARICSLLRRADEQGMKPDESHIALLTSDSELELARVFSRLAEAIESAARDLAPNRLTSYAEELAAAFHSFYTHCPVLTEASELASARLYLADATRSVLALVLHLLGVSAPESM
jgi:arginyl-tRNA synthetase